MTRIGFATSTAWPALTDDDRLAAEYLGQAGHQVVPVVWTGPDSQWEGLDAVVVRSTWDYHREPDRFLAWVDRVEQAGVPMWNPAEVLRWNHDKRYLREVEAWGFRIPRSRWISPMDGVRLTDLFNELESDDLVIKPVVSASASGTIRVHRAAAAEGEHHLAAVAGGGGALVQAFVPEVLSAGEWSLIFLGGEYSHGVVKRAGAGDFRVQDEWGGSHAIEPAPEELITEARRMLARVGYPLLYARVDGVADREGFLLMELELIEPMLFLGLHPDAARRFSAATQEKLAGRSTAG